MPWFVMIPPTAQSASDAQKRLVDFRVEYTDPKAIAAVEAGQIINGSNYGNGGNPQIGEDLVKWKGPFATEDQAKAAQAPRQQSPNPASDAVNAAQNVTTGPIAGLEAVAHIIGDIGKALTDGKMWRSVGWILLGIIVFGFGLLLWLRKPVEQAIGTAAKAVAF